VSTRHSNLRQSSQGNLRPVIVERLRVARPGLDEAIHAHVREVAPAHAGEDLYYEAGQYAAVAESISFGLDALDPANDSAEPVPPAPLAQARRAARFGVPLEILLRRYHAGQARLLAAVEAEMEQVGLGDPRVAIAMVFILQDCANRLTAEVTREYEREITAAHAPSPHLAETVERLLAGVSLDSSRLKYRMDGVWHLCMFAVGDASRRAVGTLAAALNCELLNVPQSESLMLAWFGGFRPIAAADLERVSLGPARQGVILAASEPCRNFEGWRRTYRQAQAALRIALLEQKQITLYSEVAWLTPWIADPALARDLIAIYLGPLNNMRDGGVSARETLRAYFHADGQLEVAAKALEVHRHTLTRRLDTIERQLGYPPHERHAGLALAMRLEVLLASLSSAEMGELVRRLFASTV